MGIVTEFLFFDEHVFVLFRADAFQERNPLSDRIRRFAQRPGLDPDPEALT